MATEAPPYHSKRVVTSKHSPAILVDPDNVIGYNTKGNPVRKGVVDCSFYMSNGFCSRKLGCPYSHPLKGKAAEDTSEFTTRKDNDERQAVPDEAEMCDAVYKWVEENGGEVELAKLRPMFLSKHPEYLEMLKIRPKAVFERHPDRFEIINKPGGHVSLSIVRGRSPMPRGPEMKKSFDVIPPDALDALESYIRTLTNKTIAGNEIGMFYKTYPQFNGVFTKRFAQLAREYPWRFTLVKQIGSHVMIGVMNSESPAMPTSTNAPVGVTPLKLRNEEAPDYRKLPPPLHKVTPEFAQASQDLWEHLLNQPDNCMKGTDLGGFLIRFPQHRIWLKSNLKTVLLNYPNNFDMKGAAAKMIMFGNRSSHWSKYRGMTEEERNNVVSTSSMEDVREELRTWVPFHEIGLDLDIISENSPSSYRLKLANANGRVIAFDVSENEAAAMLIGSGLADVIEDENVVKVCHTSNLIASRIYGSAGLIPRKVFDLRSAGTVIFLGSDAAELSICSLLERCKIPISNTMKRLRVYPEYSSSISLSWTQAIVPYYLQLYKAMSTEANAQDMLALCFQASQNEVMRGIRYGHIYLRPEVGKEDAHEDRPTSRNDADARCAFFVRTGTCKYGERCRYVHDKPNQ